jgi:hypothetical protein
MIRRAAHEWALTGAIRRSPTALLLLCACWRSAVPSETRSPPVGEPGTDETVETDSGYGPGDTNLDVEQLQDQVRSNAAFLETCVLGNVAVQWLSQVNGRASVQHLRRSQARAVFRRWGQIISDAHSAPPHCMKRDREREVSCTKVINGDAIILSFRNYPSGIGIFHVSVSSRWLESSPF